MYVKSNHGCTFYGYHRSNRKHLLKTRLSYKVKGWSAQKLTHAMIYRSSYPTKILPGYSSIRYHKPMYTYIYIYICVCICIYIYIYIYIYILNYMLLRTNKMWINELWIYHECNNPHRKEHIENTRVGLQNSKSCNYITTKSIHQMTHIKSAHGDTMETQGPGSPAAMIST